MFSARGSKAHSVRYNPRYVPRRLLNLLIAVSLLPAGGCGATTEHSSSTTMPAEVRSKAGTTDQIPPAIQSPVAPPTPSVALETPPRQPSDETIVYTGQDLADLPNKHRVRVLDASGVNDEDLAHLREMVQLQVLWLPGADRITDAGVVHIARLPRLRALSLRETNVTDK